MSTLRRYTVQALRMNSASPAAPLRARREGFEGVKKSAASSNSNAARSVAPLPAPRDGFRLLARALFPFTAATPLVTSCGAGREIAGSKRGEVIRAQIHDD
jgi:hypothetical protein